MKNVNSLFDWLCALSDEVANIYSLRWNKKKISKMYALLFIKETDNPLQLLWHLLI